MKRFENQLTGMAGEYLTVGKLFKKGLQAAVTVGNAKAIDILAYNPGNNKNYNVQVKTVRRKNAFLIQEKDINQDYIFVFIILNEFEKNEEYFIIKGSEILIDINKFFGLNYRSDAPTGMDGISYGKLKEYKDNWSVFDE